MMDLNKSLALLELYFQNTNEKALEDMFEKYNNSDFEGVDVNTYFSSVHEHYPFLDNNSFEQYSVTIHEKTTCISPVQIKTYTQTSFDNNNIDNFVEAA